MNFQQAISQYRSVLAHRVLLERSKRKWSMKDLAGHCMMSVSRVNAIEEQGSASGAPTSLDVIVRVAAAFDVAPSYLLTPLTSAETLAVKEPREPAYSPPSQRAES